MSLSCRTWDASGVPRQHTIVPGPILTPSLMELEPDPDQRQAMLDDLASNPMMRIGNPEELAPAAVFLASDASSFMTGSEVTVDGDVTCRRRSGARDSALSTV